jgi:TldD protein
MKLKSAFFFLLCLTFLYSGISGQEPLLDILQKELNREFIELNKQEIPVYFMSYRVTEKTLTELSASFGCVDFNAQTNTRQLTVMVRIGSPELDNYHELKNAPPPYSQSYWLPVENGEEAIRQILWQASNNTYFQALQRYTQIKGTLSVNVPQEDKSSDFSVSGEVKFSTPALKNPVDKTMLEKLLNKIRLYSKIFNLNKEITSSSVRLQVNYERHYFVSSEGSAIAENFPQINLSVSGQILSDDGMEMPLYKSYFATKIDQLPQDKMITRDIEELVKKLGELKQAPVVDPYSGPALLSGEATGVFFHEIFGHRVEASRMKSESDAQTFKNKVGQQVLNKNLSVTFDPTIRELKGYILSGSFEYDDEGMKSQKVTVVNKGILTDFLTNRTPIKGFQKSNGHGRANIGLNPVSRQSNLIVDSDQLLSEGDLRKLFIEEVKKQNLEFGFYFKTVSGGFTMTNRIQPNAFNVTPLEVYKVYSDGRPDELVRGINLVGTPLAMFSEIEAVGGSYGLFVGTCGAESGGVPVSSVCPMMFVKKIEIQKKPKSNNTKPILEKPF